MEKLAWTRVREGDAVRFISKGGGRFCIERTVSGNFMLIDTALREGRVLAVGMLKTCKLLASKIAAKDLFVYMAGNLDTLGGLSAAMRSPES